ncbi:hypothetical protein T06_2122 [Trichinella sp. T6]|nr:hypothetical protein T06_2122 [Trichinella sp. T6]
MRTHKENLKGSVAVSGKNECEWSALVKDAQRLSKDQIAAATAAIAIAITILVNENECPEQQSVGKKTSLVPRIFREYSAMRNYCNSGYKILRLVTTMTRVSKKNYHASNSTLPSN